MASTILQNMTEHINGSINHSLGGNGTVKMDPTITKAIPSAPPHYVLQTIFICDDVLMPIVCFLGILGNGVSLCVLTRREMAAATTCFLTALAVSDIVLLTLQIPPFFKLNKTIAASESYRLFIRYYTVIKYVMNNVFITCTGWLTVAVTTERFISLRFMLHPKLVCTIPRARKAIIAIFLASFLFHFSKFFEYVPNPDLKSPRPLLTTYLVHTPAYETYVHIASIALAAIIPVFLLIVANAFLIYFLATHRKKMLRHKATTSTNMSSVDMFHVTAIVVATVLVFIFCHSVGVFLGLSISTMGRRWAFSKPSFRALKHINALLVMVNSSVNFLLYCAISRKFRKNLKLMFQKRLKRRDTWTSGMPLSDNSTGTLRSRNVQQTNSYASPPSTASSQSSSSHNGTTRIQNFN